MYALISTIEPRYTGYRVAQVQEAVFPVSEALYWVECADNIVADEYFFNLETNSIELTPIPEQQNIQQPVVEGAQTL